MCWSYPVENSIIHTGPLCHSCCQFPANSFSWSLNPECMFGGPQYKASASAWTLVVNLQQMCFFFLLISYPYDPSHQSFLTLCSALLSLCIFPHAVWQYPGCSHCQFPLSLLDRQQTGSTSRQNPAQPPERLPWSFLAPTFSREGHKTVTPNNDSPFSEGSWDCS